MIANEFNIQNRQVLWNACNIYNHLVCMATFFLPSEKIAEALLRTDRSVNVLVQCAKTRSNASKVSGYIKK